MGVGGVLLSPEGLFSAQLALPAGGAARKRCANTTPRPPPAPQVIGTAIALLLLSRGAVPLWGGVLVAAGSAYTILFLERLGVRYLEVVFELLIAGEL